MNEFEKTRQRQMLTTLKFEQLELLQYFKEEEKLFAKLFKNLESDISSNTLTIKKYYESLVKFHEKILEAYRSQLIEVYDNALNQDNTNGKKKRATKGRPSKYSDVIKQMMVVKYENGTSIKNIVNYVNSISSDSKITDKQVRRILEDKGVYRRKVRSSNER